MVFPTNDHTQTKYWYKELVTGYVDPPLIRTEINEDPSIILIHVLLWPAPSL